MGTLNPELKDLRDTIFYVHNRIDIELSLRLDGVKTGKGKQASDLIYMQKYQLAKETGLLSKSELDTFNTLNDIRVKFAHPNYLELSQYYKGTGNVYLTLVQLIRALCLVKDPFGSDGIKKLNDRTLDRLAKLLPD